MTTTLITGASSGLGAEMARQLGARGEDLVLMARNTDAMSEVRRQVLAADPQRRVEIRQLDVTDTDAVFASFAEVAQTMGGLDRVIVNAGIGLGGPLGTGEFEANRQTLMTNTIGALAQMEAALTHFRARGEGHLVVIASIAGLRGMRGSMTAYAASKAAVASLAEGVRSELMSATAPAIDVTTIYPGYILTPINADIVNAPFRVDVETGVTQIVEAIAARKPTARVPAWPWRPAGTLIRALPLRAVRRFT